jgi:Uma2 family endonuclease
MVERVFMDTIAAAAFSMGSAGLGPAVKRWTVDEYRKMMETGLLGEGAPIELIDGMLVYKDRRDSAGESAMRHGPRHALAVAQLVELNARLASLGFHMRIHSPIAISRSHEPEPDGAVFAGRPVKYQSRLPPASDACLVVEVADSSLDYDGTLKYRIYAAANIPSYWIVNLRDNVVEIYQRPDMLRGKYCQRDDFRSGEQNRAETAWHRPASSASG